MFLSLATTHRPATDLGFLLGKNPARVHEAELSFGRAIVCYPQANEDCCEVALTRFVAGEPLRRWHDCVLATLALESEPLDPRL